MKRVGAEGNGLVPGRGGANLEGVEEEVEVVGAVEEMGTEEGAPGVDDEVVVVAAGRTRRVKLGMVGGGR